MLAPTEHSPAPFPPHLLLPAIIASADEAIFSKTLDGTVTSWNPSAERIFGFSAEEMIGVSISRLIPPGLEFEERDLLRRVRSGERIEHFESRRLRKDGRTIFVSLSISPIRDTHDAIIGASYVGHDITQLHVNRNARSWLAAIVDSSDDAIISKDLNGIVTSWNSAAVRIFGYTAEEIVGQSVLRLIPPELQGEEPEILRQLRAGERIDHFETIRLRKDGTRLQLSLTISPIRDEKGAIIGASKVARDISAQRDAELVRRRLAAIIDSSDDAIISKDLNGIITTWNTAAVRIFGYEPDEIIGKSVLTLIPPELQHDEPMILGRLRRGQRIEHFETTRVHKAGHRITVSLTISPIRDGSGRLVGASKIARDITGQRKAEIAERRLAAIVDSSDDAIIGKDLNGIVTSWNAAATRLFGYTDTEMIGRSITTLMRDREAREEPAILERIARGEKIEHYETVRQRKDGSLVDVSLSISAIRDGNGIVIGASKIARDITKQKAAERERIGLLQREQASRQEAEALLEAARGLATGLDLAGTVQRATDIATKLSGATFGAFFYNTLNERQETHVLHALSGASRDAFENIGLLRNTEIFAPTFTEQRVIRIADVTADPRYGHTAQPAAAAAEQPPIRSYLAVPVVSRDGEVIGALFLGHPDAGVFTERSERIVLAVAAQAAVAMDNAKLYARLEGSAARLNFSLAALELGDWTWNVATDELRLSDRSAEIYGLPRGFVGKRDAVRACLHPDDRERARLAAKESALSGRDYDVEYRVQHPTLGERWVAVKGRPQFGAEGRITGMLGVTQDITDRKRAEMELRESRAKLQTYAETLEQHVAERTAKLTETIGELEAFSYSVSHDMRTPLRAMHGYAERLLRVYRTKLDEEAVHHLERISKNAQRLELLVRDVLSYSRVAKADIELKPVELEKFLDNLVPSVPELQREDVALVLHRPLPSVLGHEAYLSQVFTNLFGNAVKFAAEGRKPQIDVRATSAAGKVTIEICDNGIGIEPEHFDRIFQIFGRVYADNKFDGTGIGLSIVRKAVQRMGGHVSVRSKVGEGSCFSFTLPSA